MHLETGSTLTDASCPQDVEAPLTASQLLRELCADMYVSPLELEDMVRRRHCRPSHLSAC